VHWFSGDLLFWLACQALKLKDLKSLDWNGRETGEDIPLTSVSGSGVIIASLDYRELTSHEYVDESRRRRLIRSYR
jgi:hypothetical protein